MHNRCEVIGHLGKDPEIRHTQSGQTVANFSVAHTEKWTGRDGAKQEKTIWFSVAVWGKQAESCGQYLAKGSLVMVAGPIDLDVYQHQGKDRANLQITAREVRFLSWKGDDQAHTGSVADPPPDEEVPF